MLWRPALAGGSRPFLKFGGTIGILATTLTTLHLGQLTLTLDLIVKLLITFAYTHGFPSIRSGFSKHKYTLRSTENAGLLAGESKQDVEIEVTDFGLFDDGRNSQPDSSHQQIIATAVGWREDKDLYRKCLQGLIADPQCGPVIAGIDGDTAEDEEMVKVFLDMFPVRTVIRLKEPVSRKLDRYMLSTGLTDVEDEGNRTLIMEHISNFIRGYLEEAIFPQSINEIQALCMVQPHQSKKDILFTALSFASVISEETGIPYLFSTDSDSSIVSGGLSKIVESLDSDSNIGGVSGHLRFSHPQPCYLTRMTASRYWFEQEIPKAQGAIFGATECQPGPCAGFRVTVLKSILVPWYLQRTFGRQSIINEDRHLTTRILWAGFAVHYAPGAIVHTDTPNTFDGWVKQQVRWSRGTMIETLWYPWMINQLSPWHCYNIIKGRVVPLLTFWYITTYALGFGSAPDFSNILLIDVFCSLALQAAYLVNIGADQATPSDIIWLVPSQIWFFFMSPGIAVWSLVTIFDDSWGNLPRAMSGGLVEQLEARTDGLWARIVRRTLKMKPVVFQAFWLGIIFVAIARAFLPAKA